MKKDTRPRDQEWISYPEFEAQLYAEPQAEVRVSALTRGPLFHWFGYYDKFQTDPADRFALSMEVGFDKRSPCPEESVSIGMIDMEEDNRWIPLGTSVAWGWQQGCMLQWLPDSPTRVLWNDRVSDRFVTRLYDVSTGDSEEVPGATYHVHPSGNWGLSTDFERIQVMRPGYGYAGVPDVNDGVLRPENAGVYALNYITGQRQLLVSIADVAALPYADEDPDDDIHYFNHIAFSPAGSGFLFLHRWKSLSGRWPNFRTRMMAADSDGSNLRVVTDIPLISHFVWRDDHHILMWADGAYRLFDSDGSGRQTEILRACNGHQSYLPNLDYLVADTYADSESMQNLFLFHVSTKKVIPVARVHTNPDYFMEWRVDLHPRLTRDGMRFIIDSTHTPEGRQMYLVEGLEQFL